MIITLTINEGDGLKQAFNTKQIEEIKERNGFTVVIEKDGRVSYVDETLEEIMQQIYNKGLAKGKFRVIK